MPILSLYLHRSLYAITFYFVKSNYLSPRTNYVKAFCISFLLLMFYCNSDRISFSSGINEKLQFLQVNMLIFLKTMIVIFTFEMSSVRFVWSNHYVFLLQFLQSTMHIYLQVRCNNFSKQRIQKKKYTLEHEGFTLLINILSPPFIKGGF